MFLEKRFKRSGEETTFLGHLEILRKKILISLLCFVIVSLGLFAFGERLLSFLTLPLAGTPINLIAIKPQEKVLAYIRAAFFSGFIITFPVITGLLYSFLRPALKENEKAPFTLAFVFILIFFFSGVALAYYIILPFACTFFYNFSSGDGIVNSWSLGAYLDLAVSLILILGGIFQLPLLLLFLLKAGLVELKTLKRLRRQVLLGIFIIAAVLTPPDIYTQITVGTLLYLLYEATILFGRFLILEKGKGEEDLKDG